jgi:hypothetical protein
MSALNGSFWDIAGAVSLVVPFHDFRTVLTGFEIVCTWFVMSRTLGAGSTLSFQMLHSMAEQM